MAGAGCFGVSYVFLYQVIDLTTGFGVKKFRKEWVMMHEHEKGVHTNKRTSFIRTLHRLLSIELDERSLHILIKNQLANLVHCQVGNTYVPCTMSSAWVSLGKPSLDVNKTSSHTFPRLP